jgi:hypothetical protein
MSEEVLREQLAKFLKGGYAHMELEKALRDFPEVLAGKTVPGSRNTPWRLLEHIRIAQWDILGFTRDAEHLSPEFPDGYWPDTDSPPDGEAWDRTVDEIARDLDSMIELVSDPSTDLFASIPHGDGQTILREALLVADNNAYHLGQLMMLRRLLDRAEGQPD